MVRKIWEWILAADRAVIAPVYHIFFIASILYGSFAFFPEITLNLKKALEALIGVFSSDFQISQKDTIYFSGILLAFFVAFSVSHMIRLFRISRALFILDEYQRKKGKRISQLLLNYGSCTDMITTPEEYNALSEDVLSFIQDFSQDLSVLLSELIGAKCHVTFKTHVPENEQEMGEIKTWARSSVNHIGAQSDRDRVDEILESYHARDNTAFFKILSDDSSRYYLCNWLRLNSILGRYSNKNNDWKKYYHSTLVIPITNQKVSSKIGPTTIWGFICADSLGGRFDKKYCLPIMYSFSRICHNIFKEVSVFGHGDTFNR